MRNLSTLRDSIAVQLKREGREVVSNEELVGMLDTRQLSDMLREHVIHRR